MLEGAGFAAWHGPAEHHRAVETRQMTAKAPTNWYSIIQAGRTDTCSLNNNTARVMPFMGDCISSGLAASLAGRGSWPLPTGSSCQNEGICALPVSSLKSLGDYSGCDDGTESAVAALTTL